MRKQMETVCRVLKHSAKRYFVSVLLFCLLLNLPASLLACTRVQPTPPDELDTLRPSTAGEYTYFATEQSNTALRIRLPSEWKLTENDTGYDIGDGEASVGTVTLGDIEESADAFTEAQSTIHNQTAIKVSTGVYKRDGKKIAVYRVTYTYTDDSGNSRVITLEIDDKHMDTTAYKWFLLAEAMPIKDYHIPPRISLQDGNGKASVLILGNSFLYNRYSGIGLTLPDLITAGGKVCSVTVKGNGYATVSAYATQTDSNYKSYIDNIKAGKYGVVLMCGLYSCADVDALDTILAACRTGNAQLVLFPAHNESKARIEAAKAKHPDLICLDWKGKINSFINAGLTEQDFCVNDQHDHSNALAGYVGAALVYEALFGEKPPALPKNASAITQEEVDAKLNTVSISPTVLIPEKGINYFSE